MAAEPFLFGKLPAHGDFVWRGLTPEAHELWDAWASSEIEAATTGLGDRFETAHDQAMPCRFVAGPGDLAPGWRAGALAPSIDSAGRRFLVVVGFEGLAASEAMVLGAAIADRCEGVLRRALIEPLSADDAIESLAAVTPCAGEIAAANALGVESAAEGVWWRAGDSAIHNGAAPPVGLMTTALNAVMQFGGAA